MNLKGLLLELKERHQESQSEVPFRHLEDWVGEVLNLSWSELKTTPDLKISKEQDKKIINGTNKLLGGYPLAYLLGTWDFYGLKFKVDQRVLIPRPETEILVEETLKLLNPKQTVFDLGAGSGCIGLSIAHHSPQSKVHLFEASEDALALCRANAESLKLKNVEIHSLVVGKEDFKDCPLAQVIVANPPYIAEGDSRVGTSVHQYEPHQALYADDDGLFWIKSWATWSYEHLQAGGYYLFEFGKDQESKIAGFIKQTDYDIIEIIKDHTGTSRFFKLQK